MKKKKILDKSISDIQKTFYLILKRYIFFKIMKKNKQIRGDLNDVSTTIKNTALHTGLESELPEVLRASLVRHVGPRTRTSSQFWVGHA